jgi:hypothetical protein
MAPAWEGALSALMSRIRGLLSREPLKTLGVSLSSSFGQYQLLLPADSWVDLEAGLWAIDEVEGYLRAGEPLRVLGPATVAASIARRPFLSGIDGEWVEGQRRVLERQLLRALKGLCRMFMARSEALHAVETATEAVTLDPFRESSHQLLMQAHAASENRPEALRAYQRLCDLLQGELGTGPSPETQALYRKLKEA